MDVLNFTTGPQSSPMAVAVLLAALICTLTYVASSAKAALSTRTTGTGAKRPPLVPYWVPGVGNLVSWMRDTHGYVTRLA